ncbi:MAG: MBOAT family O-acyltransferase [Alphaproteobacteria bacterium]
MPLLLGISFITFHRISYLVDSYKGRAVPPRGFLDCALYIFLFPQLIAGPIIRYHDIGEQIHDRKHTVEGFLAGFFRFSVGLAKKLIIADPLGLVVDKIFDYPAGQTSFMFAWGGIIAYTLQIYFDFSGYSDMALGLGRMMGFRFPENFNRPYISRSVTEFWTRWHISLSNWMRLYLYIPLGGNRLSVARTYANLWIVFLISGIWHGASWNFVAWGAYYGFFLSLERAVVSSALSRISVPGALRHVLTLLIVIVGWVFFRSPSLNYATGYIGTMFGLKTSAVADMPPWGMIFGNRALATMIAASFLACSTLPRSWRPYPKSLQAAWTGVVTSAGGLRAAGLQFVASLLLLVISAAALVSSDYTPFLYFRF